MYCDIKRLNEMPLYRTSLGSKELFHSEMIQMILEWYPDIMSTVLASWIGVNENDITITKSKRETEGYKDLVVYYKDKLKKPKKIIIENKVKRLPTEEQLESYSQKKGYSLGILLSFIPPHFMKEGETKHYHNMTWISLSYKRLIHDLQKVFPKIHEIDPKNSRYIKDYILMLNSLVSIPFDINWESGTLNMTKSNPLWKALEEIRFQDVYEKHIFREFSLQLYEWLKKEFPNVEYSPDWKKGKPGDVFIYDGYIRRSGLFDIKVLLAPKIAIDIQFQAQNYKLMIEGIKENRDVAEAISYELLERSEWFDFFQFPEHKVYPDIQSKGSIFNGYGEIRKSGIQWIFSQHVRLENPTFLDLINWSTVYTRKAMEIVHESTKYLNLLKI